MADNSMFPENERTNPVQLTSEQQAQQEYAHQQWLLGRYCIGCQAVGVNTDAHGYCATCVAAFDARWNAIANNIVGKNE